MQKNYKICIIDDDEVYKFFMKRVLKIKKLAQDVMSFADGEAAYNYSGSSVALSSDGSTVAIGAPFNDGNGSDSGHVRVYTS